MPQNFSSHQVYAFRILLGLCDDVYKQGRKFHPFFLLSSIIYLEGHSWLGYYFWDKGLKDFSYIAVDLGVYHYLLLFDQ